MNKECRERKKAMITYLEAVELRPVVVADCDSLVVVMAVLL